jgi:hypothetical protein
VLGRRRPLFHVLALVAVSATVFFGLAGVPSGAWAANVASAARAAASPGNLPAATAANTISPSATSNNSNIPVYYIPSTGGWYLKGIHACKSLGNDGFTQGVMCTDMYAAHDPNGGIDVTPVVEGICQSLHNGSYPECAEIYVQFELARASGLNGEEWDAPCGHSSGSCGTGRHYVDGFPIHSTGCDTRPGSSDEFWTLIWGYPTRVNPTSYIELPGSAQTLRLQGNLASQHAIVCPA